MKWIFIFPMLAISINLCFAIPIVVPQDRYKRAVKMREHPGFDPLISHVDFRRMADYVIDQSTYEFDPDWIEQGDTIYVNIWMLPWFEQYVHDRIKHPYILISCDVDNRVPLPGNLHKLLYDPKCAAWFCRNIPFTYHPKLQQLPWGQDITVFITEPTYNPFKDLMGKVPFEKKHLLYMNHFPRPFGDRDKIVKLFENAPFCFTRNDGQKTARDFIPLPREQFYEEMGSSKFTISPFGLETDSVRTWEALVFGSIPIVEHTFLDAQYEGLPIVIVYEWEEITEEFLHAKYEELKDKSREKAYFAYWRQMIKDRQLSIKNNNLSSSYLDASLFEAGDLQDLTELLKEHGVNHFIYRGFLATLRPLQLANALGTEARIFLYDPYLERETWHLMIYYVSDASLLKNKHKIHLFTSDYEFDEKIASSPYLPIFLDLTYYRNSLIRRDNPIRHCLKPDLLDIFKRMHPGTMLCGNMANENYVKKVLDRLSRDHGLEIKIKGNFWSVLKKREMYY